jgi:hypothetical protein
MRRLAQAIASHSKKLHSQHHSNSLLALCSESSSVIQAGTHMQVFLEGCDANSRACSVLRTLLPPWPPSVRTYAAGERSLGIVNIAIFCALERVRC